MTIEMTFAPSTSAAVPIPVGMPLGSVLPLPSVDGGNVAARITNSSGTRVWFAFGTGPFLPVPANGAGCLSVPAGGVVLVPTAAGAATGMGAHVEGFAGAVLTFERGTITTSSVYGPGDLATVG